MKKLLLVAFGAMLTVGAMAQAKQEEKKDLREDVRDKRAHKKAVRSDLAHLRFRKAHQQHEGAEAARKEEHATSKNLRAKGEEHPTREAKKIIHKQKEAAERKNG